MRVALVTIAAATISRASSSIVWGGRFPRVVTGFNLLGYSVVAQLTVYYSILEVANVPATACFEDGTALLPLSSTPVLLSFESPLTLTSLDCKVCDSTALSSTEFQITCRCRSLGNR